MINYDYTFERLLSLNKFDMCVYNDYFDLYAIFIINWALTSFMLLSNKFPGFLVSEMLGLYITNGNLNGMLIGNWGNWI